MSQNVLGWTKFFVPDQKFIHILWRSQTFCARQKDDLHSVKLVFMPTQKFLKRHLCLVLLQVSKCFVPVQIFCVGPKIYLHIVSNKHFARQKDGLHSVKLFFVPTQKFLKRHCTKCNQIFGLAQKIWTGTKHFETCKRTRH